MDRKVTSVVKPIMVDKVTGLRFELVDTSKFQNNIYRSCNYSSVATRLIKEAAKCERYSSDFLIDWENIMTQLKIITQLKIENSTDFNLTKPKNYYFGFRDCGVDGKHSIECKFDNPSIYGTKSEIYFSIYIVSLTETEMTLWKCIEL